MAADAHHAVPHAREPDRGLLVLDSELPVQIANRAFCEMFSTDPKRLVGEAVQSIARDGWEAPDLVERLERLRDGGDGLEARFGDAVARDGGDSVAVTAKRLPEHADRPALLLVTFERQQAGAG